MWWMAPGIPDRPSSVRGSDLAIFSLAFGLGPPLVCECMIVERLKPALVAAEAAVGDEPQNLLEQLPWMATSTIWKAT